jgi:hypothetical protein
MRRNAVPVVTEEGRFASTGEYRRWKELETMARAGLISNVERQPKFPLVINGQPVVIRSAKVPNGRRCVYTADAAYDENGERVVEDFKGYDTDIARLRRAVVEAIYGIRIKIVTKRGRA